MPMFAVLIIIMIWCFYLKFMITFIQRNRIVWVEVFDSTKETKTITRKEAKNNLRKFIDITKEDKNTTHVRSRFDQHWYDYREI
jgi:hypothetical protein